MKSPRDEVIHIYSKELPAESGRETGRYTSPNGLRELKTFILKMYRSIDWTRLSQDVAVARDIAVSVLIPET